MKFSALIGLVSACGAAAASLNIVETAQSVPELSDLVGALISADLVNTLSDGAKFTVFAPTNAAFEAIGCTSATNCPLNIDQLRDVLLYHVVEGTAKSTDLTNMQVLLPLDSGHSLGVNLEEGPGRVRIVGETNAVTVTTADVICSNGVVHIVDAVLMPSHLSADQLAAAEPMTIVETAQSVPELSDLVGALISADLVNTLSDGAKFTVFAPTNAAFEAIGCTSATNCPLNIDQLRDVLLYHVVEGTAKSTDLTNMQVLLPLDSGHSLGVNLEEGPGRVRIVGEKNAVTVTTADVICSNGVVHIVDAVLMPSHLLADAEVAV